jgi:hypothetical protein
LSASRLDPSAPLPSVLDPFTLSYQLEPVGRTRDTPDGGRVRRRGRGR